MDKLKYIKIKQEDGTYSEEVPVGVDASNVDMSDGRTLPETLGLIDVDANGTVKQQLDELNKNKVDKDNYNSKVSELESKNIQQDNIINQKVNQSEYNTKISDLEIINNRQDSQISQMIQNPGTATEGNSELLDIRNGANGTVYNTAGDAVRAISSGEAILDKAIKRNNISDIDFDSMSFNGLSIFSLENLKIYRNQMFIGYDINNFNIIVRGECKNSIILDFQIQNIGDRGINKISIPYLNNPNNQILVAYTPNQQATNISSSITGYPHWVTKKESSLEINLTSLLNYGYNFLALGFHKDEFYINVIDRDCVNYDLPLLNFIKNKNIQNSSITNEKIENKTIKSEKMEEPLSQFPFDNNSDLKKNNMKCFDKEAFLYLKLYNCDKDCDYYVYNLWSRHVLNFTRCITIRSKNRKTLEEETIVNYQVPNENEDLPNYIEFISLKDNENNIIAEILIDWSKVFKQEYGFSIDHFKISNFCCSYGDKSMSQNDFDDYIQNSFVFTGNIISKNSYEGKRYSTGYNTSTRLPNWIDNDNFYQYTILLPKGASIKIGRKIEEETYPNEQGYLREEDGTVINNFLLNKKREIGESIASFGIVEENGIVVSNPYNRNVLFSFTIPASYLNTQYFYANINKGYLPSWLNVSQIIEKAKEEIESFRSNYDIILPYKFYHLKGVEINIYYQNIVRYFNPENCQRINTNLNRYSTFARLSDESGYGYFEFYFNTTFGGEYDIANRITNVIQVESSAGSGLTKKCLFIGDSLTDADKYTQELLNLFSGDSMSIELIGTRGSGSNKNEGVSGWRAYTYTRCPSNVEDWATWGGTPSSVIANNFWNSSTSSFDFSYYMNNNGYESVDYVFICLGTNDIARNNHQTDEEIITYFNEMINSIKNFDSNIKIGIWLPPTRGLADNNNRVSIDVSLRMNKLLIDTYDKREEENLFLIPIYLNIDPYHDYNFTSQNISARNPNYTINICTDAVHPAIIGYQKIADVFYGYIKYFGSLDE